MPFLRESAGLTVAEVRTKLDTQISTWQGPPSQVAVALTAPTPVIRFEGTEVPATEDGLGLLGNFFDVPTKFLLRLQPDEQQFILDRVISRAAEPVALGYTETGLVEALKPTQRRVHPEKLAGIAATTVGEDAEVVQWINTRDEIRLDIAVPLDAPFGIGGDRQVNDLTRGGIRIGQDRKHNLAPYVQPWTYRLACTNGMEVPDEGLRVSMKGNTPEEVLGDLEAAARRAFGQVEDKIAAFYDLRNTRVENPERTLARLADEQGIPERTRNAISRRIVSELPDEVSMFDLVNLITNAANDPTMGSRTAQRRGLEIAGGAITNDHHTRCSHCAQKV